MKFGCLAQLVEHQLDTLVVIGSSPIAPTTRSLLREKNMKKVGKLVNEYYGKPSQPGMQMPKPNGLTIGGLVDEFYGKRVSNKIVDSVNDGEMEVIDDLFKGDIDTSKLPDPEIQFIGEAVDIEERKRFESSLKGRKAHKEAICGELSKLVAYSMYRKPGSAEAEDSKEAYSNYGEEQIQKGLLTKEEVAKTIEDTKVDVKAKIKQMNGER